MGGVFYLMPSSRNEEEDECYFYNMTKGTEVVMNFQNENRMFFENTYECFLSLIVCLGTFAFLVLLMSPVSTNGIFTISSLF